MPGVLCVLVAILWEFWFGVMLCRGLKAATESWALGRGGSEAPRPGPRGQAVTPQTAGHKAEGGTRLSGSRPEGLGSLHVFSLGHVQWEQPVP